MGHPHKWDTTAGLKISLVEQPLVHFLRKNKIFIWHSVLETQEIVNGEVAGGLRGTFSSISRPTMETKTC